MAAHYSNRFPSAVPVGSLAASSSPLPPVQRSKKTRKTKEKRRSRTETHSPRIIRQKQDPMSGARGSLPPGFLLLLLSHYPCRRHHPFLLFLVAIPIFLHWRRSSSYVGGPQEVERRGAAPLIRQKRSPLATSASPLRPLALAHSVAFWSFHWWQCLNRWSRVCCVPQLFSGSHHQQWPSGRLSTLFRYTPVRACPDLSW